MITDGQLRKGGIYVWRLGDQKHQATLIVTQITTHLVYAKLFEEGKPVGKRFFNDKGMFLQECSPMETIMGDSEFVKELRALINRQSMENGCNTPDFILAEYLDRCLMAFDLAVNARERWFGRHPEVKPDSAGEKP